MKETDLRAVATSMSRDIRFPGLVLMVWRDLPFWLQLSCGEQPRMLVDFL